MEEEKKKGFTTKNRYVCNNCGESQNMIYKNCPHCGAIWKY